MPLLLRRTRKSRLSGGAKKSKKPKAPRKEQKTRSKVGRGDSRKTRVVHKTKQGAKYVVRRSKSGKVRKEYLKKKGKK